MNCTNFITILGIFERNNFFYIGCISFWNHTSHYCAVVQHTCTLNGKMFTEKKPYWLHLCLITDSRLCWKWISIWNKYWYLVTCICSCFGCLNLYSFNDVDECVISWQYCWDYCYIDLNSTLFTIEASSFQLLCLENSSQ